MRDDDQAEPRWWAIRPARNLKAATYTCPLCRRYLSSMSEHLLLAPEGNQVQRRHAHTQCVLAARKAGRLPTLDEWRAANKPPGFLSWLRRRRS